MLEQKATQISRMITNTNTSDQHQFCIRNSDYYTNTPQNLLPFYETAKPKEMADCCSFSYYRYKNQRLGEIPTTIQTNASVNLTQKTS